MSAKGRLVIWDGARAFFGGIGFVVSRPGVWPYAAVPVVVLFLLVTGLALLGLWGTYHLATAIIAGASAWAKAGQWLLEIILGSVALLAAVLFGFAFAQPLSGFALESISEKQGAALRASWSEAEGSEHGLGGLGGRSPPAHHRHPKPPFFDNLKRSIVVNMLGLAVSVPVFALLTIVELVAPPASVVTWPLKFIVSALLLAWDLLDYPLGLRGVSVGERLSFFGRNFWPLLLFGSFGAVILLVPGLGLLLLPFGVAGATRLVTWSEQRLPA